MGVYKRMYPESVVGELLQNRIWDTNLTLCKRA